MSLIPIEELVALTSPKHGLEVIPRMLDLFNRAADAYGCIIWEPTTGSDLEKQPESAFLMPFAQKFDELTFLFLSRLQAGPSSKAERYPRRMFCRIRSLSETILGCRITTSVQRCLSLF
jgi:hypothetical protein